MIKHLQRALLVTVLLGGLTACDRTATKPVQPGVAAEPSALPLPRVSGSNALEEVRRFIQFSPRDAGTEGGHRAAKYLARRLAAAHVPFELDFFEDRSPGGTSTFVNVMGRLEKSNAPIVILSSHFDTKAGIPDFVGANDSGSSSGLLLELARVLATLPERPFELWFVFFDGEEAVRHYSPIDGLHGSRHLARKLKEQGLVKRVRAQINLDMIGDQDLTVTLPRNSTPDLLARVFDAARAEGARQQFTLVPYEIGDDHVPLLEVGIPAVNIIDFQFGSAPGRNNYWHTPADTLDKLSADSLEIVGNVTLRVVWGL